MPHNRFGVKSTKAEVLFIDYINEHLKPNGRAGIIVPEGVIFQSGTAYKQLRKRLLETSLIGVISLPAGVFQPYSGVKTSILILDKEKNKKNNEIFFINIKNDGFDLTANRKKIKENDFPNIVQLIKNQETSKLENVTKEEIFKNDCSLNYSSYKNDEIINSNYKLVFLKDFADLKRGTSITKKDITEGDIPVIAGGQKPAYFHNKSNRSSNCITVSSSGAYAGYVAFHSNPIFVSDCFTIETNNENLNQKFLFYLLKSKQELIYSFQTGGGQPHVYAKDFDKFKIPLPEIETQNQIVDELDAYQKIIDGCRQVIENYKPSIDIDPSWEMVELGNICDVKGGKRLPKGENFENNITKYPYIRVVDFEKYSINTKNIKYISEKIYQSIKNYTISSDDIFISIAGTIGLVGRVPLEYSGANLTENAAKLVLNNKTKILVDYLMFILGSSFVQNQIKDKTFAVGVPKLAIERIKKIKIPVCSTIVQKNIVENIKQDFSTIENNQKLLEKNQNIIKNKLDNIWSK